MSTDDRALATQLAELGMRWEVAGDRFRARAFARAADVVRAYVGNLREVYNEGGRDALEELPGIGSGIALHIEEYLKRRSIPELVRMRKKLPVQIADLLAVEGVGPKTLLTLYTKLKICTRTQLLRAAKRGLLAKIRGIGPGGQTRIMQSIEFLTSAKGRALPGEIWPLVRGMTDALESLPGVHSVDVCGSLRRREETIGDIDVLVTARDAERVLRTFVALPQVATVYSHGDQRALVRLTAGIDMDCVVVPTESRGAALIAWTGNAAHNVQLRTIAKHRELLLDDYGLFRGGTMVASRTEREVYRALGLQEIPPELRDGTDEIALATAGTLPHLIGYGDLKGDLHVHTDWSDGAHTILEMAQAAHRAGLSYIAITDHTQSLGVAHGLTDARMRQQWREIDRVQKLVHGIRILKGAECDILADGRLDLSDATLALLDWVGISVHSGFDRTAAAQTKRILRAMEHPAARVLCHPTGRLLERRAPYALNVSEVIAAAVRTGVAIELNASAQRLDCNAAQVREATKAGARIVISSDSHDTDGFSALEWGIGIARRGRVSAGSVLNTQPVQHIRAHKKRTAR